VKKLAYLLSLVMIFAIPWENSVLVRDVGTISRAIGLLLAAVWVAAVVMHGTMRRLGLFHGLAIAFVTWNALSVFWTIHPPATVQWVWTYVQLLILAFLLWDLYDTTPAIRAALQAYVLGAYVAIASLLLSFVSGTGMSFSKRYTVEGFNADTAGLLLAIGMPMAWTLALVHSIRGRGRVLRWMNFAYLPLAFFGIALTGTRTALLTTFPAVLFAIASLTRLRPRQRLAIGLAAVIGFAVIVPFVPQPSVERLLTTGSEISGGTLGGRGRIWQAGLRAFGQRPILGVGAGAFEAAIGIGKVAHNTFISVLVELGIVGATIFYTLVAYTFGQALRHPAWGARFWVTLLSIWALGASSLTWENKKITWLVLTLAAASAAVRADSVRRRGAPRDGLDIRGSR
jgi:O-antigen ligase